MLQPVNQIKFYTNNNLLRTKQNTDKTHTDSFVNNKSLPVSFGWCEKHQVRSKEISMIFLNQLKLQNAKEQEANYKKTRLEYLDIANNSNKEAMNFLMQFTNRQKNEAEFIPLWSLMNNEELRTEMNKSPIFKDPVQNLISLNLLQDIKVKNSKITQAQLNRARGSLQVHTAAILLNQIDNNLGDADGLVFVNKKEIKELAAIVKAQIDSPYGANTYEKLIAMSVNERENFYKTQKEGTLLEKEMRTRIDAEVKMALVRVAWNFKTAVPMWYPQKHSLSFLLPLCLVSTQADVALVVERQESGKYQGQTILPLQWAYSNARLICRPDSDWLSCNAMKSWSEEEEEESEA